MDSAQISDRELLELAAKAADNGAQWYAAIGMGIDQGGVVPRLWNPLKRDGDALRLAVKLGFSFNHENDIQTVAVIGAWSASEYLPLMVAENYGTDAYAATRRAIVRAAAAIGAKP